MEPVSPDLSLAPRPSPNKLVYLYASLAGGPLFATLDKPLLFHQTRLVKVVQ